MPTDPLDWLDEELAGLQRAGLRRTRLTRDGVQSPTSITLAAEGCAPRRLANFSSNDYLGLAAELGPAVCAAIGEVGWGSGASPLVTGRGVYQARLESELAAFEGATAALLFTSGLTANTSTIDALVGHGDAIISDSKNHASLIDGCRLSGAEVFVYHHADAADAARQLAVAAGHRRRLLVTDSLFSMDGDVAPLPDLAELARRHGAMLMVDEAHATGVFGPHGRGVCEALGVEAAVSIRMGTLSKALGSIGGFVVGSQPLIDYLAHRARAYMFSTALPDAAAAAGVAALAIVRDQPQRRRELLERAARFRHAAHDQGWRLGATQSQIVPLIVGQPQAAVQLAAELHDRGYWAPPIRPPSVPPGQSLVRVSLSYPHDDPLIDGLLAALAELAPRYARR